MRLSSTSNANFNTRRQHAKLMKAKTFRFLPALATACAAALPLRAEVRPAAVFTDGAVLQAHRPVPVWGKADAGERVTVSYGDVSASTVAAKDGSWRVALPSMDYVRKGRTLRVVGTNTVAFSDVLVGEVWLGIGQSNMEYPLDLCKGGLEIAKGGVLPTTVRYFHLPKDGDEKPRDLFGIPGGVMWRTYTAENFRENKRSSGLMALFAQRLVKALDVPIGVIGAAVGGANLETWMSAAAAAEAGMTEDHAKFLKMVEGWHANNLKRWENRPEREKNRPRPSVNYESRPHQVFNAMIPPLAPYALKGIFYYQGEMNSGWQRYEKQFPYMVRHVRKAFEVTDQPFFIVQLPDYKERHWIKIRDIQRRMSETLPRSGLVVTIDGNEMELHPRDKDRVADRMVGLALTDCYGRKLPSRSPAPIAAAWRRKTVVVTFKDVGAGLRLTDGETPRAFELVGVDGRILPAAAQVLKTDKVALAVPQGFNPVSVRYAWAPDPDVNLVNEAGLPATPFELAVTPFAR